MFDRDRAKGSFQTALKRLSGDPYLLAKLLRIQPVSPNRSSAGNKSRESLQHDGVDWSGVLNAWIDANVAAVAVSNQMTVWIAFDDLNEPPESNPINCTAIPNLTFARMLF